MDNKITEFTQDVENIQKLGDNPNSDNSMTADELKALFDKAPSDIKSYLNGVVVPAVQAVEEGLRKLKSDFEYVPIEIISISHNAGIVELGTEIKSVTVTWKLNKDPVCQILDGDELDDVTQRSEEFTLLKSTYPVSLKVTDERGHEDTSSTTILFLPGVYYGALQSDAIIDSTAINGLSRSLQSNIKGTFNMVAGAGQKLTFAAPARYGEPTSFFSGGFDYTWTKVKTFDHTNSSGHTESYNVWQNDEIVIGTFSVTVKQ